MTDNFVNLLHISYEWLYKTECWGRKFHAFSFNSHRNCKIFMTNFIFIFDTICVPYIFRKSIFGWNCDHDTPLCDTPLLEDTPLCDTPDDLIFSLSRRKNVFAYIFSAVEEMTNVWMFKFHCWYMYQKWEERLPVQHHNIFYFDHYMVKWLSFGITWYSHIIPSANIAILITPVTLIYLPLY